MHHVFLAVDLDDELKRRLDQATRGLHLRGARVSPAHQAHLTIRFLGEVADEHLDPVRAAIERAAAAHERFPLELMGGGTFGPPGRPRVAWVGVRDATRLQALADDVDGQLANVPCAPRDHPFAAHITIARARGQLRGDLEALTALAPLGTMIVQRLTLFRSVVTGAGSTYQALALAPLG